MNLFQQSVRRSARERESALSVLQPARVCRCLTLGLGIATLPWLSLAGEDPPGVSAFKTLLERPPVIEAMVYRETLPPKPSTTIPMDTGISRSTNYAVYEVRWQPNAMSAQTLESNLAPEQLDAYRTRFTLWDDQFWFLDNRTNVFVYHLEHERVRRGDVPPSYDAAWYRISRYGEILNLGLSHLRPGSIRWDGSHFQAQGLADKQPMYVSGHISRLTNGVPCELTVRYSNGVAVVDYRLVYGYRQYLPPFYPNDVTLLVKHGPRETAYRRYEILSVKTGDRLMSRDHFDPEQCLENTAARTRYLTNDSVYVRLPSGKLLETPSFVPNAKLSRAEHYRNRYFYFVIVVMTGIFIRAFFWRTRSQRMEYLCGN